MHLLCRLATCLWLFSCYDFLCIYVSMYPVNEKAGSLFHDSISDNMRLHWQSFCVWFNWSRDDNGWPIMTHGFWCQVPMYPILLPSHGGIWKRHMQVCHPGTSVLIPVRIKWWLPQIDSQPLPSTVTPPFEEASGNNGSFPVLLDHLSILRTCTVLNLDTPSCSNIWNRILSYG